MLRRSLLALGVLAISGATLHSAGLSLSGHSHGHCHHCGCHKVRKVCVPVKEIVKETTFEYSCECEDFCVPGRSKCVGTTCKKDCNGCCQCEKILQPTCGKVMTKTKLMKLPVVKEKCVTKWVVKTVCCNCGQDCGKGSCADGNCIDGTCTEPSAPHTAPVPPPSVKQASALVPSPLFTLE